MSFQRTTVYPVEVVAKALLAGSMDLIALPDGAERFRRLHARQLALFMILPQILDYPMEGDPRDG